MFKSDTAHIYIYPCIRTQKCGYAVERVEKAGSDLKIAQIKSQLKGKPPTRVSPQKQSTGLFFYPFLRFMRQKIPRPAGRVRCSAP